MLENTHVNKTLLEGPYCKSDYQGDTANPLTGAKVKEDAVLGRFLKQEQLNPAQSKAKGEPVYNTITVCQIKINRPQNGDIVSRTIVEGAPHTKELKVRFKTAWEAFEKLLNKQTPAKKEPVKEIPQEPVTVTQNTQFPVTAAAAEQPVQAQQAVQLAPVSDDGMKALIEEAKSLNIKSPHFFKTPETLKAAIEKAKAAQSVSN